MVNNYDFKTISVKEMEPNFVRLKVPAELKNNLQVGGISVANYRHEELVLNFNVCRSS